MILWQHEWMLHANSLQADRFGLHATLAICFSGLVACTDETIRRPEGPATEWTTFGGAPGGGHYSEANEITRENVHALEIAWVHNSGDSHDPPAEPGRVGTAGSGTSFKSTPIMVDGTLFYSTPYNRVFALDPATGAERWVFDPEVPIDPDIYTPPSRGVSSWKAKEKRRLCNHRILLGTIDGRLIAIDAETGARCQDFGEDGQVDLTEGLTKLRATYDYAVTSPPALVNDLVIVGAWVIDGNHSDAPSGVVRAYDVRSGEFRWGWNAVAPGQETHDEDGNFRGGTANVWSIISVDEERNLVIVPTGNPYPDYYGGNRNGLDHYSSSVVALDGDSGEVVWRFQTVHHDIWDFDVPAQPTFVDLSVNGRAVPAVVQVTKMGLTFVLHRETGEPIFPVEERPVPQEGAVPGEVLSPTQPFPTKPPPLVQLGISPEDAWGLTFWDRGACKDLLEELTTGPIYTPQTLRGTAFYPSQIGGHNWGSPAIDPQRKLMVVNTNHIPLEARLIPREECDEESVIYPQKGTPYCYSAAPLMSPWGIPCTKPPWGTISLVDLSDATIRWTRPMGTLSNSWPLSMVEGGVTLGGPLITETGLIFVGASMDKAIRALDIMTGDELWKADLPTSAFSVPMAYRLNDNGTQFVVIAAGGGFVSPPGDHLIAFALPTDR